MSAQPEAKPEIGRPSDQLIPGGIRVHPCQSVARIPSSDLRHPASGKSFSLLVRWSPRRPVYGLVTSGCLLVLRRAALVFCATALLGTALEYLQQLVPVRASYAHSEQILWSVAGAFVGAFAAASLTLLFGARDRDCSKFETNRADNVTGP